MKIKTSDDRRRRIKFRLRKRSVGSEQRPRLTVFRSLAHIYVQVIDDASGSTLVAASTLESSVKGTMPANARGGNLAGAQAIGKLVAERALAKGIKQVVFDRNGFLYHGRIRAVAEAAREAGLSF
jgi:large subunit ribosomal protein L18